MSLDKKVQKERLRKLNPALRTFIVRSGLDMPERPIGRDEAEFTKADLVRLNTRRRRYSDIKESLLDLCDKYGISKEHYEWACAYIVESLGI